MVEPTHALFITALLLLIGGFVFWPDRGYFWRWQKLRRLSERVLIEDALKHVYNYEYRKQSPTMESLAGALGVPRARIAGVLVQAVERGLVQSTPEGLQLTPEGRDCALHIIRVHRLWEHYLAEETGVDEATWHSRAENREHDLSRVEADDLAQQMGHPAYDPHGDPIPTAAGEIAPRHGQPLATMSAGELATIVHIEDEPEEVYSQLIGSGLHLGMQIEASVVSGEKIEFRGEGVEYSLDAVVAANVSIVLLPKDQALEGPYDSLALLKPREKGEVIRISKACRGLERRRLMDLGILPGTVIEMEMKSPSGDPTAYRIRGASIALRKEQADQIHILRQTEAV